MAGNQNTIEFLLQIKQEGQEAIDQLKASIDEISKEVETLAGAFNQASAAGDQFGTRVPPKIPPVITSAQQATKSIQALNQAVGASPGVFQALAAIGSGAFGLLGDAATTAWAAIEGPLGIIYEIARPIFDFLISQARTLLSFLNPFSLQGLLTGGVALAGVGVAGKDLLEAADDVKTYQMRLQGLLGDQDKANRLFSEFHDYTTKVGVDMRTLVDAFEVFQGLNIKDPEKVVENLVAIAQSKGIDPSELIDATRHGTTRSLNRLGVNLQKFPQTQTAQLTSGSISKTFPDTEAAVTQNIIDLLQEKFPAALDQAQQRFEVKLAIFQQLLHQFAEGFGAIILPAADSALDAINGFLGKYKDQIVAFVATVPDALGIMWNTIQAFFDSGQIGTIIGGFVARIMPAMVTQFEDGVSNMLNVLVAAAKIFIPPIEALWQLLLSELQVAWQIFADNLIPTLLNSVTRAVESSSLVHGIASKILSPSDLSALDYASAVGPLPTKPLSDATAGFETNVNKILDDLVKGSKTKFSGLGDAIKKMLTDGITDWKAYAAAVLAALNEIPQKGGSFSDQISAKYQQHLTNQKSTEGQRVLPGDTAPAQQPIDPDTLQRFNDLVSGSSGAAGSSGGGSKLLEQYQKDLDYYNVNLAGKIDGDQKLWQARYALAQKYAGEMKEQADERTVAQDEYVVSVTHGYDQMYAQAKLTHDKEIALIQDKLNKGEIKSPQQAKDATDAADQKLADDYAKIQQQKILAYDDFLVAVSVGVAKQAAEAQAAYDKDVAGWQEKLNQQLISQDQFNQLQIAAEQAKQEKLRQIKLQQQEAGEQIDILVAQSQGNMRQANLEQIQLDSEKQIETYRQQLQQGLIDQQQFDEAKLAIETQTAQKEQEITGTFFEGMSAGYTKMQQNMATNFQLGQQFAQQTVSTMSSGFSDFFGNVASGTESISEAFEKMASQILSDLWRLLFNQIFTEFFASAFGTGTGGAGLLGSIASIGSLFAANKGGEVPGYSAGGRVAGTGPDMDTVAAMLTPGEFVVRRTAVQAPGVLSMLHSINAGHFNATSAWRPGVQHFATGGVVQPSAAPSNVSAGATVVPVLLPNASNADALLSGNVNVLLRIMEENKNKFNSALGNS